MIKLIILIALVCLGLASARGFDNRGRSGDFGNRGRLGGYNRYDGSSEENGNILLSRLCANATWPPAYVAQVQALITALINNGTFRDWFQEHAQEVAYFQNNDNTAFLPSNCTGYFSGLKAARVLDRAANIQRRQYTKLANRLFADVFRNLVGDFSDDSHGK